MITTGFSSSVDAYIAGSSSNVLSAASVKFNFTSGGASLQVLKAKHSTSSYQGI